MVIPDAYERLILDCIRWAGRRRGTCDTWGGARVMGWGTGQGAGALGTAEEMEEEEEQEEDEEEGGFQA